jgi:hypothetical protein
MLPHVSTHRRVTATTANPPRAPLPGPCQFRRAQGSHQTAIMQLAVLGPIVQRLINFTYSGSCAARSAAAASFAVATLGVGSVMPMLGRMGSGRGRSAAAQGQMNHNQPRKHKRRPVSSGSRGPCVSAFRSRLVYNPRPAHTATNPHAPKSHHHPPREARHAHGPVPWWSPPLPAPRVSARNESTCPRIKTSFNSPGFFMPAHGHGRSCPAAARASRHSSCRFSLLNHAHSIGWLAQRTARVAVARRTLAS